jgi:hypothetical protein
MHKFGKIKYLLIVPVLVLAVLIGYVSVKVVNKPSAAVLACNTKDLSGVYDFNSQTAFWDGAEIQKPLFARNMDTFKETNVLGLSTQSDKWIEVDLSEQKMRAWNGNTLFAESAVSSGLPGTPTPPGEYHIWVKLRYTKMEGGEGRYYYNLPNVPFTMFFENESVPRYKGYGLHGAYWHNSFGTPRSHGCVNLPIPVAEQIFYWADPVLPEGKGSVWADENNPGTRIVIHE